MKPRTAPLDLVVSAVTALAFAACSGGAAPTDPGAPDASADATAVDGCSMLFGRPNDKTGLGADRCQPSCACGATVFTPPTYDDAFVRSLVEDFTLSTPSPPLAGDPYAGPAPTASPESTVCAVVLEASASDEPRPYGLATYASEADARAAGAKPTHFGRCGVCSSLENLAVYMRENDLAAPVRACGLEGGGADAGVACLRKLGFDLPCAQAWYYDTAHTKAECLTTCLAELSHPYQLPDGTLNPCIQCDEEKSGPVFKATAGRTRRNSGLPNSLCRPCSEVRPLVHAY